MSVVTYAKFFADLETSMRLVQEQTYLDALDNVWWKDVAVSRKTSTKNEVVSWIVAAPQFSKLDEGGNTFTSLASKNITLAADDYVSSTVISKSQVDDFAYGAFGGEAAQLASQWLEGAAGEAALLPQGILGEMIRTGGSITSYDGLPFFSTAHLNHPADASKGTYSNDLVHASNFSIHTGTTEERAAKFQVACAEVKKIKTPTGKTTRNLKVVGLLIPPALEYAANLVTGAKFIDATDMSGWVAKSGIKPIVAPELGADYSGGSDTTYYLVTRMAGSEVGAFVHVDREAFNVNYHGPEASAMMARTREVQYVASLRTGMATGHPYGLIRVRIA